MSIAAGKTTEFIEKLLGFKAPVIRIMPNINATVLEAMSAYCCSESVTDDQKEFVNKLCSSFGKVMPLSESYFPLFCSIAGCAPAYAYMFIDSLARSAVKNGMNKSVALEIAAQTVLGSAKKILESDEHPWELIDKVCSPGGTTIEGIVSLQKDGFESAVCNAVDAALQKDKKSLIHIKLFITKCIFFGRPLGGRPFLCYGTFVLRAVSALRFHTKISRAY